MVNIMFPHYSKGFLTTLHENRHYIRYHNVLISNPYVTQI